MTYKFGTLLGENHVEHRYDNVFAHEVHPEWSRVTIAPRDNQIALMLEIAEHWEGSYGILYLLKLSRRGHHNAARYQVPQLCSWEELESFARKFHAYFEGDGRHHLWFVCGSTGAQLVYDNHNLIYAYGNDNSTIELLESKGFMAGDPAIPSPHSHCYNEEFDASEDEVMEYFDWLEFPLREEHDDP